MTLFMLGTLMMATAASTQPRTTAVSPPAGEALASQVEVIDRLGPNIDGDQVVCEVVTETGTRLGRRRVCRTRAEWAEHRREVRERTERAQNQTQTDY